MFIGGCNCLNGISNFSLGDVLIGNTMLPDGTTTVQLSGRTGGRGWYEVWLRGVRIGTLRPGGSNGIYIADGAPIPPEPRAIAQPAPTPTVTSAPPTPVPVSPPAPTQPTVTNTMIAPVSDSPRPMLVPTIAPTTVSPTPMVTTEYVTGGSGSTLEPLTDDEPLSTEKPTFAMSSNAWIGWALLAGGLVLALKRGK